MQDEAIYLFWSILVKCHSLELFVWHDWMIFEAGDDDDDDDNFMFVMVGNHQKVTLHKPLYWNISVLTGSSLK